MQKYKHNKSQRSASALAEFERRKANLRDRNLSSKEYEEAVRKLADELRV